MRNQLRRIFFARLDKIHFVSGPERASFLAISGVEIIGRGNELRCWQRWLFSPLPSLLSRFKLLLPNGAQSGHGRQCFYPVWGARSLQHIKEHPTISPYLIGVLHALLRLLW